MYHGEKLIIQKRNAITFKIGDEEGILGHRNISLVISVLKNNSYCLVAKIQRNALYDKQLNSRY